MKEALSENNIEFMFIDIFENPMNMKKFLKIRDTSAEHEEAREKHYIGIPCLLCDGKVILPDSPEDAVERLKAIQ